MRTKKLRLFFVALIISGIVSVFIWKIKQKDSSQEVTREITPVIGNIRTFISCTGTILPKNRLEIKSPVNGRIERILVQEGNKVKAGQILAWMSSTERAALLDAARGKGEETLQYWEETYKPIPLSAPIDGEVIVATTQPGQTVTTADAVLVLSDHLITRAQVDETDIGRIKLNQQAVISLDAYPQIKVKARVDHISYESKIVNNVTIYEVDILPESVSEVFRSGMSASVDIIETSKENILLIPLAAVNQDKQDSFVLLKQGIGKKPVERKVELGVSDENNVEVISGLTPEDKIIVKTQKYSLPKKEGPGSSPLTSFGRRR